MITRKKAFFQEDNEGEGGDASSGFGAKKRGGRIRPPARAIFLGKSKYVHF